MNPLVQKHLETLDTTVKALARAVERQREAARTQAEQRDKLLQDHWKQSRELAVLRRAATEYDGLKERFEDHQEDRARLREELTALLRAVKTLQQEFRQ